MVRVALRYIFVLQNWLIFRVLDSQSIGLTLSYLFDLMVDTSINLVSDVTAKITLLFLSNSVGESDQSLNWSLKLFLLYVNKAQKMTFASGEAYLKLSRTSKMQFFPKIANRRKVLTNYTKISILDVLHLKCLSNIVGTRILWNSAECIL